MLCTLPTRYVEQLLSIVHCSQSVQFRRTFAPSSAKQALVRVKKVPCKLMHVALVNALLYMPWARSMA